MCPGQTRLPQLNGQSFLRRLFGLASGILELSEGHPSLSIASHKERVALIGIKPKLSRMGHQVCLALIHWVVIAFSALSSLKVR